MRRELTGLIAFGLFACNAILGNENHYTVTLLAVLRAPQPVPAGRALSSRRARPG